MPPPRWTAHVHVAAERELQRLPAQDAARVVRTLQRFAHGTAPPGDALMLTAVPPPGSFRLRVGSYRVLGVQVPAERMLYVTVVFRRAGPASYSRALVRHRARVSDVGLE